MWSQGDRAAPLAAAAFFYNSLPVNVLVDPEPIIPTATIPAGRLLFTGVVVFLANAALLVLQLVAGRLLAPYVGSSLATWTAVIGVFLAGISAGNYVGGRLADRWANGWTLRLLLAGGGLALLSAVGVTWLLGDGSGLRRVPLMPRIAITSLLVCFPSAFVLSLTTPVTIKLLLPDVRSLGRVVGAVYGKPRIERGTIDPGRTPDARSVTDRTKGPRRHGRSSARLSPTGALKANLAARLGCRRRRRRWRSCRGRPPSPE